jgi:ornithine cyclodeaminase/alanine dehydrogenase-like protein (mu-crystallin family)
MKQSGAQTSSLPIGASRSNKNGKPGSSIRLKKGIIGWNKIHELGEILDGSFPGRTSDEQITFHANNNGTAAADLAIAQWVYEQCRRMGRGSPIELPRPGDQ